MNILITGGASGLGATITTTLAQETGNQVYLTYLNSLSAAQDLQKRFKNVHTRRCDFSISQDVHGLLEWMNEMNLDVLINNAITGMEYSHFHKINSSVFSKSFQDNVLPTIEISKHAIGLFRKKKSGKIITILTSALIGNPPFGFSEYVANKAYLSSMSKSWAVENAKFNITSNCISPSLMKTKLTEKIDSRTIEGIVENHPLQALISPEEVVKAVQYLLQAKHANGMNLVLNMGENVI